MEGVAEAEAVVAEAPKLTSSCIHIASMTDSSTALSFLHTSLHMWSMMTGRWLTSTGTYTATRTSGSSTQLSVHGMC